MREIKEVEKSNTLLRFNKCRLCKTLAEDGNKKYNTFSHCNSSDLAGL